MTQQEMIDFIKLSQEEREAKYAKMNKEVKTDQEALNIKQGNLGWCSGVIAINPKT